MLKMAKLVTDQPVSSFIYIADPVILAIPIEECQEPLIDIKDRTELQYGPPPENELTTKCYTKMRETVFEKLCRAQADLPKKWHLRLYEGFRSLQVQQMLFEQEFKRVSAQFPNANYETRFRETTRLVSPVTNLDGSKNIPPHNTGAAVDVEIIMEDGQLVDMGMTAKDWYDLPAELCMSDCDLISNNAQVNRKLLRDIMEAHGFVNYPTEWWHFSYGDRYWAYHRGMKKAIYGPADTLISTQT